jgi:hypothetical protein
MDESGISHGKHVSTYRVLKSLSEGRTTTIRLIPRLEVNITMFRRKI